MITITVAQVRSTIVNNFKVDVYRQSYLLGLELVESRFGIAGLKSQVLYVLANAMAKGEAGKKAKKSLIKWAQS